MGTFISDSGNINGTVNTVAMFTPNSFSAGNAPIKISPVNSRPASTNTGTNSIVGGYNNTVTSGTLDNMIFGYNISSGGSNTFYSIGHDNAKSGLVGSDIMLLGFFNNFTNQGSNIVTLGSNNTINGISSISEVIGFFNTVTAPDRSVIQGYQNNIAGALLSSIIGSNNTSTGSAQYVNIVGTGNSTANSNSLSFVGAFNNLTNSTGVSITGDNSIITASTIVYILGNANTVDGSSGASILGDSNIVDTGSSNVAVIGVSNTVSNCSDVTVIGQTNNTISLSSKVLLGAANNGFQIEETTARMKLGPFAGALTFGLEIATNTVYFNSSNITFKANCNFIFNTGSGTRFGTATTQRLSFWNKVPIVQPTTAIVGVTPVTNTGTAVNTGTTFEGYTLQQVVKALRNIGLLA